jgi:hypothetical protein
MTPWFDKYTRPHWIGVYETRIDKYETSPHFNYWNGLFWEQTTAYPWREDWSIGVASKVQHIEWRGFTKEQI